MKPERWNRIQELFHEALSRAPHDRIAFLDQIAADDAELREEVLSLLRGHEQEGMLDTHQAHRSSREQQLDRIRSALSDRYTIESEAGRGGMATVYRARDLKHQRSVAIKVLHPSFAQSVGPDRFLAEIETTAGLHHPHILPLFDSGEADGLLFFVMPYVEGESLRERLTRDRQLPVAEAVRYATQMAGALDYAHRRGIIHRDIKPGNVLLQDGQPVISDFGIALAVGGALEDRLTIGGYSPGTPSYMSPEQVTGEHAVGPASDTYSLACVLYEMLVGEPPHGSGSPDSLLNKVARGVDVSPIESRKSIPAHVDAAIRKALERLPADRFSGAREFAAALNNPAFRHGDAASTASAAALRRWKIGALTATALCGAMAVVTARTALQPDPPTPIQRFDLTPAGQSAMLDTYIGVGVTLSPDGDRLVYVGAGPEGQQLWQRSLDALDPSPLPWTEGADNPVFSPDGSMVAFREGANLKTVSLRGGLPTVLLESGITGRYIDWGPDGYIYFATDSIVSRIPATGGEIEPVTARMDGVRTRLPRALPGGRGVLVTLRRDAAAQATVGVAEPDAGEIRELFPGLSARYASSGHLVYATPGGTLMAAPFDLDRLEVTGPSVEVMGDLDVRIPGLGAQFTLSSSGTLVYRTAGVTDVHQPVWVDREGTATPIDPEWSFRADIDDSGLALSPSGDRIVVSLPRGVGGGWDLWIKEVDGGAPWRLTDEGIENRRPTWSGDGQSVTYIYGDGVSQEVRRRRADGVGGGTTLDLGLAPDAPSTTPNEAFFSRTGEWLIFRSGSTDDGSNPDIYALRFGIDTVPRPLQTGEHVEWAPALSPDGRWLAYVSDQTGRSEVYVRPFPEGDSGPVRVSGSGGSNPVWATSGRELFYRDQADALVAARVVTQPTFTPGSQTPLFSAEAFLRGDGHAIYDVAPDDSRFLMLARVGADGSSRLVLVRNWFTELARLVPE